MAIAIWQDELGDVHRDPVYTAMNLCAADLPSNTWFVLSPEEEPKAPELLSHRLFVETPSAYGRRIYPPEGKYLGLACTCRDSCRKECDGDCGCRACHQRFLFTPAPPYEVDGDVSASIFDDL